MAKQQDLSIYAKKYYRVVLHSIDKEKESIESFAIKISMRLKTPLPRVMQILRHLPCTMKSGLSVSQANRLYNVMEDLGAHVSMETYFLTPGEECGKVHGADISVKEGGMRKHKPVKCPACGWENEKDAEFCSLCLEVFRKKEKSTLPPQAPEENPVIELPDDNPSPLWWHGLIFHHRLLIGGLILLAILVLAIMKK